MARWRIELAAEVSNWYVSLSEKNQAVADRVFERLANQGNQLRMPHSRALGDGLYELRFNCENVARRISYVFEPRRRVVTLTTFRKQRHNERAEILRARRIQAGRQVTADVQDLNAERDKQRTGRKR